MSEVTDTINKITSFLNHHHENTTPMTLGQAKAFLLTFGFSDVEASKLAESALQFTSDLDRERQTVFSAALTEAIEWELIHREEERPLEEFRELRDRWLESR